MMVYNSVRGIDSTGAASVKRVMNKGEIDIVIAKEVGHPYNLLSIKRKDEHDMSDVLASTHRMLMGHCRASTKGASTRYNAHPFCFDNILGTHNGTLSYISNNKLAGSNKFDTDSEAIFNEIEGFGIGETVKKFQGYNDKSSISCPDAYALVWFDAKDNSVNFLRNKERPLWFAFDTKKEQLFWSSEDVHLLASMVDIPHEDKFLHCLPVDEHYSWVIPNNGAAFGKPRVAKRQGAVPVPFSYETKKTGATGSNVVHTNAYQDANGDSRISWTSTRFPGFFEKYNQGIGGYKYSSEEFGTYFTTIQEAWDSMAEPRKLRMVISKEVPDTVNSGYVYDEEQAMYVKVVKTENKSEKTVVKMYDEVKFKKLREATIKDAKAVEVFKDMNRRAYWDTENRTFLVYTFMGMHCDPPWDRQVFKTLPVSIPFTNLDVEARHQFKHVGRGKKRVTYFSGFQKEMLVRPTFEKLMKSGCANCKRTPHWGNDVQFITKEIFMCEYCQRDADLVKQWKQLAELDNTGEV